jgi:ribokinase
MGIRIKLTVHCSQAFLAFLFSNNYDYKMKVVGLGQCALDHLFVVDPFPVPDTKNEVIEWTKDGGGPVATALVSLSRIGVKCCFYGIIGDDESGRKIEETLRSENVCIDGLVKRKDSSSQVAFIAVEKVSGKRTIFWKRPSAEPLKPHELPDDFLDKSDFLLIDGLMFEASLYAAEKAREKEIPVMLDAGSMREGMTKLASICEYVVSSEEFARELVRTVSKDDHFEPEKAIRHILSLGAKTATTTLGDGGSVTASGSEIFHTPAFKIKAVDTTGAGDVFHGGYIYGLLQKWDIKKVLMFASAFAALKCRRLGGRAGIPGLKEVEALMAPPL